MQQAQPIFKLWPKQQFAMRLLGLDPANPVETPVDELLFGGQAGGGKSQLIRVMALYLALEYWPGSRVVIFRNTFPELYGTHILPMLHEVPGLANGTFGKYNATLHDITWPNGSITHFRHCDSDADALNYLSEEWEAGFFDEATQHTEFQYTLLRSRVRNAGRAGWHRLIVACSNPGGPSHEYFKEKFVDQGTPMVPFMGDDKWPRCFLPSMLSDNPSLNEEEYRKSLSAISDPVLRKAYRDGDWNISAFQSFTEWSSAIHVVEPFDPPIEWTRWRSLDHGYRDPTCCHWYARIPAREAIPTSNAALRVSERDRILVYREYYEAQQLAQVNAMNIRMASLGERVGVTWADPSMFRAAEGQNFAAEYAAAGIHLTRANNDVGYGTERIHRALAEVEGQPPELVVMSNCRNLVRALPAIPRDKNKPEQYDTSFKWDHEVDSLRYGLVGSNRRERESNMRYSIGLAAR